jgi:hypothetical protein
VKYLVRKHKEFVADGALNIGFSSIVFLASFHEPVDHAMKK